MLFRFISRLSLFLLLLGLSAFTLYPAKVIPFEQTFSFTPYETEQSRIVNSLLQHIAEGSGKLRVSTSYTLKGEIHVSIGKQKNGSYLAEVRFSGLQLSGDLNYKDFSLEKILLPNLVSWKLEFKDEQGKPVYTRIFSDMELERKKDTVFSFEAELPANANKLEAEVSGLKFYYNGGAFDSMEAFFEALQTYYQAGKKLDRAGELIEGVGVEEPSRIILDEFRLCEAENLFNRVRYATFHDWIDLNQNDPDSVQTRFNQLKPKLEQLREEFNQAMARIDELFYNKGMQALDSGDTSLGREEFQSALVYNPLHVPSHLALADIDFWAGEKNEALNRIGKVIATMFPSGAWKEKTHSLADSIKEAFFKNSLELMDEGRFNESLGLLEKVKDYCLVTEPFYPCSPKLNELFVKSHVGMYRSFLTVARRALHNDNLSFGAAYIVSAMEYQQEYEGFIPDNREAMELLQKITNRHQEKGVMFVSLKDFERAVQNYAAARDLCRDYPELECYDHLDEHYAEALDLEDRSKVISLDLLIREPRPETGLAADLQQVRREVLDKLSEGHLKTWAGELETAREILTRVASLSLQYQLRADSLINARILSLSEGILDKECELVQREINSMVDEAFVEIERQNFRKTQDLLSGIRRLKGSHQRCPVKVNDSLAIIESYKPAAAYQALMDKARSAYFHAGPEDFEAFFETYESTSRFFEKNRIEQFGLEHTSLQGFVKNTGHRELVMAATRYFSRKDDPLAATDLLFHLKNKGVEAREIRGLQEVAGSRAAETYREEKPEKKPRALAREITANDPWFRHFVNAFVRSW